MCACWCRSHAPSMETRNFLHVVIYVVAPRLKMYRAGNKDVTWQADLTLKQPGSYFNFSGQFMKKVCII
jgi:hypothetical protein